VSLLTLSTDSSSLVIAFSGTQAGGISIIPAWN
jgi:hypothetical protein